MRLSRSLRGLRFGDRQTWLCAAIALVVLLPGAGWGVPFASSAVTIRGWDVDAVTGMGVLSELHNLLVGAREDWYVAYPLLHYLVLAAVYAPYLAFLLVTGGLAAPDGTYPYGFADPVQSIAMLGHLGRVVSLGMASITVAGVFALVRRPFGGTAAAGSAAVMLLCAPFLFYARTGNLDVPVLFWTVLTLLAIQAAWIEGLTPRRAVACGALASLAVATKDQAYGFLAPALAMLVVQAWRQRGGAAVRPVAWLLASGVITFLVAGGVILRPDRFVRHLQFITSYESTFANVRVANDLTVLRAGTAGGVWLLAGDFVAAVATAVGWPALVLGVAGLASAWRDHGLVRWLALSVPGFFVLVVVPIHHMQYRYALGPAIVVAVGVGALLHRLQPRRLAQRLVAVVAIGGAVPGALELTHGQAFDARRPAAAWMAERLSPGDTLGFFGRPHQLPHVPRGVVALSLTDSTDAETGLARWRPRWLVVAPDYFADATRERSNFLPAPLYAQLKDGSRGWAVVQRFATPPLLGRPLPYLPYVNPVVQVFERTGASRPAAGDSGVAGGRRVP